MATTVGNVSAVKPRVAGCVFRAPLGTTLPTDATTALDAAFKDMGYISDDGITESNARESDDVVAYGGDVVASLQTSKTDTWQMTFIEVKNADMLKAMYGNTNVTGSLSAGMEISINSKELESAVWVIDQIMSGGTLERTVIPNGKVTEIGDITYADGEVTGYEATITGFPHSGFSDNATAKKYVKNPAD